MLGMKSKEEKAEEIRIKEETAHNKMMSGLYTPSMDGIKLALSSLITSDKDRMKLFKNGDETLFKFFGGDINTFINTNAVLVNAAIQMKMLEQLEEMNKKLDNLK